LSKIRIRLNKKEVKNTASSIDSLYLLMISWYDAKASTKGEVINVIMFCEEEGILT